MEPRHVIPGLGAALAAFVFHSASGFAAEPWQAAIEGGAPLAGYIVNARPNGDGTMLASVRYPEPESHHGSYALIEESGRARALANIPAWGWADRRHGTQWAGFAGFDREPAPLVPLDGFSCERMRGWLDASSDLRMFGVPIAPHLGTFGTGIGRFDAGGGHFGTYYTGSAAAPAWATARFARDCSRRVVLPVRVEGLRNVPDAIAAYGWHDGNLVRIEEHGIAWSRAVAAPAGDLERRLAAVADDGDALIAFDSRVWPFTVRWVVNIDATGEERWRREIGVDGEVEFASDGHVTYLWTRDPGSHYPAPAQPHVLYAIDDDGDERWRHVLGASELRLLPTQGQALPTAWSAHPAAAGDDRHAVLEATATLARELMRTPWRPLARWASGNVVAQGPRDALGGNDLRTVSVTDGSERIVAIDFPKHIHLADVQADARGSVVATHASEVEARLTAYGPEGGVLWQTDLPRLSPPPPAGSYLRSADLRLGATRVCLFWQSRLACVHREDGRLQHPWSAAPANVPALRLLPLLDDTTAMLAMECDPRPDACPWATAVLRFDAHGNVLDHRIAGPLWNGKLVEGPDGDYGWVDDAHATVTVHDATHRRRWRATMEAGSALAALGPGGTAYVGTADALHKYHPDGRAAWTFAWPEGMRAFETSGIELPGGDVIVSTGRAPHHRFRLRGADGSAIWHREGRVPLRDDSDPANGNSDGAFRWILAQRGDRVLRVPYVPHQDGSSWLPGQRVVAIDIADGALLASQAFGELAGTDRLERFRAAVTGSGSIVHAQHAPEDGAVRVRASVRDLAADATVPIDASLLGAWRAGDTGGQGVFLDSDGGRAYGAWFTYSADGGHTPEALRWYTLVQDGEADAGEVGFTVYANRGGAFGALPASLAVQAGRARLRRLHCDRAMLVYSLDGGFENAIPLERSVARTRPCDESDRPTPSAAGLDPRSAGAWHDPATPGQGLAFDLRPPSGGDGGLFAGAWFTFDPAGAADDPTAQHWFTLAGTLASASDGRVEVPIFRTMGGMLDAQPTSNTERVGTATLQFTACDAMTLAYAFDDTDVAQAFRGRRGTLALRRITACTD